MALIDEARTWWRLRSMQIAAVWSMLTGGLLAYPDAVIQAWNTLPFDLKHAMPRWAYALACALVAFLVFAAARLRKQAQKTPAQ